jgi:HD-GYP domain-containing protein (c-di-GMP phosphodiesterase class II)
LALGGGACAPLRAARGSFEWMSDDAVTVPPGAGSEAPPAFIDAVAQLGATRAVRTSQAIYNAQGVKLLEGGVTIDQTLYDKLFSHRLSLPLDECIDPGPGTDAASLAAAARAAAERWPFFARVVPANAAGRALVEAVASVRLPKPVALHLTLARETRSALFDHSVLMALLSAHLVREGGGARADVHEAAAAGLLHDLGMLHIAPDLLDSEERLSGDELKPVYAHPLTSSMLVDRFAEYPKEVVRAIVEHHERLDGSGYPRGLAGAAISPLGRVLAMAEVVTAMFDGARKLPEQRVSLLLRINPRRYDAVHVAAVHRLLAAAPAPSEDEPIDPGALVARLARLTDVLALWRTSSAAIGSGLPEAQGVLVRSIDAQNATLQRMLYDAGVTREQLAAIAGDVGADVGVRVELWAIAEELLWQLHAAANQLTRRWPSGLAGAPHPPELSAWFEAVAQLDASPAS